MLSSTSSATLVCVVTLQTAEATELIVGNVLGSKRTAMSRADVSVVLRPLAQLRVRASAACLPRCVTLLSDVVDGVVLRAARSGAFLDVDCFLAHFGLLDWDVELDELKFDEKEGVSKAEGQKQ
jgi:hypothetical protein